MVHLLREKPFLGVATLMLGGTLALTACTSAEGEAGSEADSSEAGVEYGATMEDYHAAFAEHDPIELTVQTPGPEGSPASEKLEDYLAAVNEWSDGKITFEVHFANSLVPAGDADDALADGRLDISMVTSAAEPQKFPAVADITSVSFLGSQDPIIGGLENHGWALEVAESTPELKEQFEVAGIQTLVPYFNGGTTALMCAEDGRNLEGFTGNQSASSTSTQSEQVGGLGMSPVSLPYTELYESVERGVVDCALTSFQLAELGGFMSGIPHASTSEAGWGLTMGTLAMRDATWEELPLLGKQLFHDLTGVYIESNIRAGWESNAIALQQLADANGTVEPLSSDAEVALEDSNASLVDSLRTTGSVENGDAWVDSILTSVDDWEAIVGSMDFPDDVPHEDIPEWFESQDVDLQPYIDELHERVFLDSRPE